MWNGNGCVSSSLKHAPYAELFKDDKAKRGCASKRGFKFVSFLFFMQIRI
jgi:hypothetical protein